MSFTAEIGDKVCEMIAEGKSLRQIAQIEGMPKPGLVCKWLADPANAAFREQYVRAREAQADFLADETLEIADGASAEDHQVARLRFDARRWYTGKVAPKKYGDKLTHAGAPDEPIAISVIKRVIVDPRATD
jgi:hypothetical protein